ncbi:MAG: hypothetical protein J6V54_10685 [Bacteroidales bacterium]|nr:hypothetical protein [Bacteroidales bacterium]
MKQTIKTNLYAVTDILSLVAIIVLAFSVKKKDETFLITSGIFTLFAVIVFLIQAKWGQTKVGNQSSSMIYAKPEEGAEPVEVPPQGEYFGTDGVKAGGKVYKLPNGVHATVSQNGKVSIASLTGTLMYMLIGGVLPTPPDGGWQKLFER